MTTPDQFTGESLQRAIDDLNGPGTVQVPKGVYEFGDTSVRIPEGVHRVKIDCEPGTVFHYTGPDAAVSLGGDNINTEGFKLLDCEISLAGNQNDKAVALKLVRSFWATLADVRLTSDNGAPNPRQTGLAVSGGDTSEAGFSAYTLVLNMACIGSFKRCMWFGSEIQGGPSTRDRSNANTVIGGSVYCGAQDKTGSIGVHIMHGDTNRIWGTDHDSLETGILIEGHNNQANCRFENISKYAVHVMPSSQGSFIFGCSIPSNEWLDEGYETQFILTSQAGTNRTLLTDIAARYSFRLQPRGGTPEGLDDGMLWYDWDTGAIHARVAGQTKRLVME